jgi:hypothetical protein
MLANDTPYHDLGGDYYAKHDPDVLSAGSLDKPTPSASPSTEPSSGTRATFCTHSGSSRLSTTSIGRTAP